MSIEQRDQLVYVDNGAGDEPLSTREMNPLFSSVLEARLARRQVLKGSAGAAALGFFGLGLAGCNRLLTCWAFLLSPSAPPMKSSCPRVTATR